MIVEKDVALGRWLVKLGNGRRTRRAGEIDTEQ